jgi:hypothetical protein
MVFSGKISHIIDYGTHYVAYVGNYASMTNLHFVYSKQMKRLPQVGNYVEVEVDNNNWLKSIIFR